MSFTYDPALSTSRDVVRAMIGDVVSVGHRWENETIDALLVSQPNPAFVAAQLARNTAAQYASKVSKAIGRTRIELSQAFDHWMALASTLMNSGSTDGTGVMTLDPLHVGGISVAEKLDLETGDSDRIQPEFRIGKDDHPGGLNVTPDPLVP